jgi:hypothetical protein
MRISFVPISVVLFGCATTNDGNLNLSFDAGSIFGTSPGGQTPVDPGGTGGFGNPGAGGTGGSSEVPSTGTGGAPTPESGGVSSVSNGGNSESGGGQSGGSPAFGGSGTSDPCGGQGMVLCQGVCVIASGTCPPTTGPADSGSGDSCTDNQKDGQETDVDCGGAVCSPCGQGKKCQSSSDCQSGNCRSRLLSTTKTCSESN